LTSQDINNPFILYYKKIVISIEKALKLKDEISTTIQNHVNIMVYGKLRFFDEFSIAK
jgi:hypothetical protein